MLKKTVGGHVKKIYNFVIFNRIKFDSAVRCERF